MDIADLQKQEIGIKVDVLFRSKVLFDNGTRIQISVADHNCIRL